MFGIRIFIRQKIIGNFTGRFAKHIGNHGIQSNVADGENILEATFLAGTHIDKLIAIACEVT